MSLIIYTKTGCPWCIAVTDFLATTDIAYEERNVTENPQYFEEMIQKSGQSKAPTFDVDGVIHPDADIDQLKVILTEQGLL